MLPTKGYFQDIECPYYNSSCGRPYCHFRHKKKLTDNVEELINDSEKEEPTVIPTYKPTPKSELANIHNKSHIPISYVPDLAFRPERKIRPFPKIEKPTYNPTPLSILSSANNKFKPIGDENGEHIEAIKEIKQNIADLEYDPATSLQDSKDIDFEGLDSEFSIIDEIIRSTDFKKKKKLSTVDTVNNVQDCKPDQVSSKSRLIGTSEKNTEPKQTLLKNKTQSVTSEPDNNEKSDSAKEILKGKEQLNEKKDKKIEDLKKDKEHSDSSKQKSDSNKKVETKSKDGSNKSKSLEKSKKNKDDKKDKEKTKSEEKSHKSSSRDKHRKEELKDRKDKKDKSKDKHRSRSRSREKIKSKEINQDKQKQKEKNTNTDKNKEKSHSKDKSKSSEVKNDQKSKSKKEDKEKSMKHSRESRKSKERSEDRRKSKEQSEERPKNKNKESEKSKSKNKHDNFKTDKLKIKNTGSGSKNKKKSNIFSSDESISDSDKDVAMTDLSLIAPLGAEFEDQDEEETLIECYKIFTEYTPTPKEPVKDSELFSPDHSSRESLDLNSSDYSGKKRIAHTTTERTYSQLHPPEKQKAVSTPGQILANRYKMAKMAQANREQELLINEVQQASPMKRPAPSLLEAARARKVRRETPITNHVNTNVVDDILKGASNKTVPIAAPRPKIAPAQNVSLMAKAKERISKIAQSTPKTIAQTQKGARVAHVPDTSLADIPDVLQADRSKLPVNVRTRFLTMLADECVKMYISKEEAFARAINEEFSCYEKCNVLATYRNSAMLAVNRLRKEIQERNANGLGLIAVGEDDGKDPNSQFKGNTFYNQVKKWILTEEELDIHGYPRESEDHHGKAIIKNPKSQPVTNLDENQRSCCRCQKLFQVDDDGWPLFEEECLYHPMKKRTIRGEQMYLCCRSNQETGCATSDTHVSEGFSSADLEGFQTTLEPESDSDPRSTSVYALDCEMCYTTKGLELTRVTIVDSECKTVYESLVKPLNPIIDYNTRFSGITKEQMDRTSTSILQVQANILHLCNSKTILVGHSLESDMKALKIVHETIIDTSVLFPHKMGLPHKRALRALASEYLRKIIQNNVSGHDSAEDAVTCMELLKWKLKEEIKSRPSK